MFDPSDTIVATATPPSAWRSIVRISGEQAFRICSALCVTPPPVWNRGIQKHILQVLPDLDLDVLCYVFPCPGSYTGEDLVELHVTASQVVVEALLERLLQEPGLRRAGPGEFTARAYLHGKLGLAQAEAVYEIIHSSNHLQLEAAQGLLRGRLGVTLETARQDLMECLGLLEAGLDFSQEDISFITTDQALERVQRTRAHLETVLTRGLHDRETIHLPSVGIAGAPNAGKSTLFNALLGQTRSIVSDTQRTTRDVLAARLGLPHSDCLLFDCAGLLETPDTLIDSLAQDAALESLHQARCVVFCVDITKTDWSDDRRLLRTVPNQTVLLLATKGDLLPGDPEERCRTLGAEFGHPCVAVGLPLEEHLSLLISKLEDCLQNRLPHTPTPDENLLALTARHRHAIQNAIEHLDQAVPALQDDLIEVAAMLVRSAYQSLCETTQHVDEDILEQIFSRFCIGK